MDSVFGDAARVHDVGGYKMACSWGVWGILGGWDTLWGCSGGSPSMFYHSGGVIGGTERGRARGLAIVNSHDDGDMMVTLGGTKVWGVSCRELGCV